jgi:hypothetical protein
MPRHHDAEAVELIVLTKTRWLLLKRPRSMRIYLLKEDFQFFWGYRSPLLGRGASSTDGACARCDRRSGR